MIDSSSKINKDVLTLIDSLKSVPLSKKLGVAEELSKKLKSAPSEYRYEVVKNGVSEPIIELLKSKETKDNSTGAYLLHILLYENDPARTLLGQEGVIPPLLELFKVNNNSLLKVISATLVSLLRKSLKNKAILIKNGGVSILINALKQCKESSTQTILLNSLRNLSSNQSVANDMISMEIIPLILSLIKKKNIKIKKESMTIISNLSCSDNFYDHVDKHLIDLCFDYISTLENNKTLETMIVLIENISESDTLLVLMEPYINLIIELYQKTDKNSELSRILQKILKNLSRKEEYKQVIFSSGLEKDLNDENTDDDRYNEELNKLVKSIDDPDNVKAAEAAKRLSELMQKGGVRIKKKMLEKDVFSQMWRLARAGRLGWADKWYTTIDQSKIKFKEELGSGSFATVYKGYFKNKGKREEVAIKAMDEDKMNLSDLRCELATLSILSGVVENMVELKGYFYLSQKSSGVIKVVRKYHCLVMELMDTNLEELIYNEKKKSLLTKERMIKIAHDIAFGMSQIHSYNILHRDLKPANILLSKQKHGNFKVKIGDFGYARRDSNESIRRSVVGTPAYLAPELFGQNMSFDVSKKTDVYSYGVILWEMVTRKQPHKGLEEVSIYKALMDANEKNIPIFKAPADADPFLKALIEACVVPNPEQRPHFDDILKMFDKQSEI